MHLNPHSSPPTNLTRMSTKRTTRTTTSSRIRCSHITMMVGLLWSFIWFFGFILLLSALMQSRYQQQPQLQSSCLEDVKTPRITIFSAPKPFLSNGSDLVGVRQELAVRSWLALSPEVAVVLFGRHLSVLALVERLGPRVAVESAVDFTFLGIPFFHSMVARAQTSPGVSIFVDPETILLPDILTTLCVANKLNRDWFLISVPKHIAYFPYRIDDDGKHWLQDKGDKIGTEKEILIDKQKYGNSLERLLIAWNTGDMPLHAGVIPPFLNGKGLHYQWLINEVLSSDFRFVFDASQVISNFYPDNLEQWFEKFSMAFGDAEGRVWEHRVNCLLASLYGSLCCQPSNISKTITKLVKCSGEYVFINPVKDLMFSFQGPDGYAFHSQKSVLTQKQGIPESFRRFLQFKREDRLVTCVDNDEMDKVIKPFMELCKDASARSNQLLFPYSLESLLELIADKNKSIILAVAGNNYKDMLMSWVCRLRHLAVTNFVVCALDHNIYDFAVLQGLPVFKDPLAPSNISFDDCHFGTKCFQRVTKVKSRIVLQILKMGYNVLLSDVDVYWFDNPLPFLHSFGSSTLVAQSDEYNETEPINLPHRLNSGFYYVHSDLPTITAMEKVVKHACSSDLTEQPSFYKVLCGEGGQYRIGDDQCLEPSTNVTVHFLDRNLFPNGAYKGFWEKRNVRSACRKQGCLVLHNNWISGRMRKLERQVRSGLWEYDFISRMCIQNWQRTHSLRSS